MPNSGASSQPNIMPIRKRFGYIYMDGERIPEVVTFSAQQETTTESTAVLSQQFKTTYETESEIKGKLKCNRCSTWLQDIAERQKNGEVVRFTLQSIADDPNSDYSKNNGSQTYTFIDCVITSAIPLVDLDREGGGIVQDEFDWTARDYVRN